MDVLDRAVAAHRAGDLAAAEALYREGIATGWHNLGVMALACRDFDAAEARFRSGLAARPEGLETQFSLSLLLLARGRYAEGWPLHEARRGLARLNLYPGSRAVPEWRGEPLAGKRIAVVGEQGFGDQIMFARFVPVLEQMGAEATYVCRAGLISLFAGAVGELAPAAAGMDYWVLAGSLPLRLNTTVESVPPPYPIPGGAGGGGVGVVTRGSPDNANDARRSLDPQSAAALLSLGRDLHVETTGARDFAETADIIRGLDLVISVDTAVAHLAGSMGKPTWILLPHAQVDWRWGTDGASTPWYRSARLFRQPRPGDWAAVLADVRAALAQR